MPATVNRFSPPAALLDPKQITPEVEAALAALGKFGPDASGRIYSTLWADGGERYAKRNDLKPIKLSEANVGKLLEGLPEAFVEADDLGRYSGGDHPDDSREHQKAVKLRLAEAKERRKRLISWLANRNGWMDHGQLFAKAGRPHVLVGHPYQVGAEDLARIADLAGCWGLSSYITTGSWYFPARTVCVEVARRD